MLPKYFTVFIDHDSCTMYGNNFNDLVWTLQTDEFSQTRYHFSNVQLAQPCIGPAMAETMKRIETLGHTIRECVYTLTRRI
jgi:hypothetical protein